jgi:hypothetical protein
VVRTYRTKRNRSPLVELISSDQLDEASDDRKNEGYKFDRRHCYAETETGRYEQRG